MRGYSPHRPCPDPNASQRSDTSTVCRVHCHPVLGRFASSMTISRENPYLLMSSCFETISRAGVQYLLWRLAPFQSQSSCESWSGLLVCGIILSRPDRWDTTQYVPGACRPVSRTSLCAVAVRFLVVCGVQNEQQTITQPICRPEQMETVAFEIVGGVSFGSGHGLCPNGRPSPTRGGWSLNARK